MSIIHLWSPSIDLLSQVFLQSQNPIEPKSLEILQILDLAHKCNQPLSSHCDENDKLNLHPKHSHVGSEYSCTEGAPMTMENGDTESDTVTSRWMVTPIAIVKTQERRKK